MFCKLINEYLRFYAESEVDLVEGVAQHLAQVSLPIFQRVVVVPVFCEKESIFQLLQSIKQASLFAKKSVLVILVFNQRISSAAKEKEENISL